MLLYHLLWELTHVCFEHPGLLVPDAAVCEVDGPCITCSDEGRLAEVVSTSPRGEPAAEVRTAQGQETVDTTIVGPVHPGDLLLVHAGAAIAVLEDDGRPWLTGPTSSTRSSRANERDAGPLLADLARSAVAKGALSARLRVDTLERIRDQVAAAADAIAESFRRGGRLFTFGNGGSSTDAAHARRAVRPPAVGSGPIRPARWSTTPR